VVCPAGPTLRAVLTTACIWACIALLAAPVRAEPVLTLVTTTSTEHSGLMDILLPAYRTETGVTVRALVAATGKALRIAQAGDADVMIAHDKAAEDALVESGATSFRKPLMYNDFIVVGPTSDAAHVAQASSITDALQRIAAKRSLFASRGDNSGTHRREATLWKAAGMQRGAWLLETGSGQGATLNFATARGAYALTDRGTWLFFANKGDLKVLFEGGPALLNEYGVSLVNPELHAHVNEVAARAFIDWLTGDKGQALIGAYRIEGQQAFFPNANPNTDPITDPITGAYTGPNTGATTE
jgi:tungstate transport system substrate-binding protein